MPHDKKRSRQDEALQAYGRVLGPLEPDANRIAENGKRPYSVIPSSFAAS